MLLFADGWFTVSILHHWVGILLAGGTSGELGGWISRTALKEFWIGLAVDFEASSMVRGAALHLTLPAYPLVSVRAIL